VLRVCEGGEVTHRVPTEQQAIACMLGGDSGRKLFVLTAPSVEEEECVKLRGARIETLEVEVSGAGLP
jgi:sugar lactone lactonase YvrE